MSDSDWWCSPEEVAVRLVDFFNGPVGVDPCSNPRSVIQAVLTFQFGGLVRPWCRPKLLAKGDTVYENPPYSLGEEFTTKALGELENGHAKELVRLTMMSTSTYWWSRQCSFGPRNPRILALRRLKFIDPFATEPGKIRQSCRFEPALTYFGTRTKAFDKIFGDLARWSAWGR